jgi:hypothetical protein
MPNAGSRRGAMAQRKMQELYTDQLLSVIKVRQEAQEIR